MPSAIAGPSLLTAHWWTIAWQDWVGVGGTVLGVIGLVFTYFQARDAKTAANKAETAANAAKSAVERTQAQLRSQLRFVLLPGLQRVAQELDDAIHRKSHSDARSALDRWRFQAGHVRGLLQRERPEPRSILKALQQSVALSTIAIEELLADSKPILDCCRRSRAAIATANDEMNQFVGRAITEVPADVKEGTK